MAQYENLKAAVADVIKQNGVGYITGDRLKIQLFGIINNLGKYATFAGVVQPNGSPVAHDGPTFYLTGKPGTYANFGGAVVKGISALSNQSGSWVATEVLDLSAYIASTLISAPNKVHQLKKDGLDVNPVTVMDAVKDPVSGKTVKEELGAVNIKIDKTASTLVAFANGEPIDIELKPKLKYFHFINRLGDYVTTTSTWGATEDYMPLYNAGSLHYFGNMGQATTQLAFYDKLYNLVSSVPGRTDRLITDEEFNVPSGAVYFRATCMQAVADDFKIILKGIKIPPKEKVPLFEFNIYGTDFVYQNDAIKEANIVWNDGSYGRVVYSDWDEDNATFRSYVATSIENGVKVTQPSVTFNSDGLITNYPSKIISNI